VGKPGSGRAASWALLALGIAGIAALWRTGALAGEHGWVGPFLRGYFAAWVCYAAAGVVASRAGRQPRWLLVWIVVAAIGMRLVCLARTPPLSTDVWRYLWDGRVTNAGINPFRYAPNAPQVEQLRNGNWRRINFKHISTIYPPAAEMLFAGLARVRDRDAEAFRWAFALFDIGSVLALIALLQRTGRPPERVVWYAWCPLVVTEVTAGAHVDAFAMFLLLVALLLAARAGPRQGPASGLALAGAVMAKGYALLAVPFFVRRGGGRVLWPFLGVCLALLAPYLAAGRRLFGGLSAYLGAWETNASLFLIIDRLLGEVTDVHFGLTRVLTVVAVLSVVAWLTWRQRPGTEPLLAATFAAFGVQLFVGAPTLPWYVIWLAPALCWWTIPGLALFTLTVSAQYYARWLLPGDRAAHYALLWAGYVPVYALLAGQLIWARRRRRR